MSLFEEIAEILEKDPGTLPLELATQLGTTELQIIHHLPEDMATELSADQFEIILQDVKKWGSVTTIVESSGCIFEIKCPFPDGSSKFGYYNLNSEGNPFQGHLKADSINAIALISKPFHGVMTHQIMFLDQTGMCAFKIYLGRNPDRSFIEGQEQRFEALKKLAVSQKGTA